MPTMSPAGQFHLEDLLWGVQSAWSSVTSRSSRQPTLRFILTSPPSCSPSSSQSQLCHYIGNFSLLVNAAQFPAISRRVPRKCFPRRPFTKPATSPLPSTTAPTTSATTMASTSLPRTTAATSASWTQALTSYSIGGKPRVTSSTESTIRRADVSFRSLQVRFRTSWSAHQRTITCSSRGATSQRIHWRAPTCLEDTGRGATLTILTLQGQALLAPPVHRSRTSTQIQTAHNLTITKLTSCPKFWMSWPTPIWCWKPPQQPWCLSLRAVWTSSPPILTRPCIPHSRLLQLFNRLALTGFNWRMATPRCPRSKSLKKSSTYMRIPPSSSQL